MKPGASVRPARIHSLPGADSRDGPIAAIRSPRNRDIHRLCRAPLPSITRALRIKVSQLCMALVQTINYSLQRSRAHPERHLTLPETPSLTQTKTHTPDLYRTRPRRSTKAWARSWLPTAARCHISIGISCAKTSVCPLPSSIRTSSRTTLNGCSSSSPPTACNSLPTAKPPWPPAL